MRSPRSLLRRALTACAGVLVAGPALAAASVAAAPAVAGTLPSPPVTVAEQLELGLDGLGDVHFGTAADLAISELGAVLGAPTDDSGWVHPSLVSGCPGGEARAVAWGQLTVYFGDAPVLLPATSADAAAPSSQTKESAPASVSAPAGADAAAGDGVPAATAVDERDLGNAPVAAEGSRLFFAYTYGDSTTIDASPAGLATADGIGVGTPVALLIAAYPDVYLEQGEEGFMESRFYVDEHLQGTLTDAGPDGLITVIVGGNACMMTL